MTVFRQIRRGVGYLPGVGSHPGNPVMLMFLGAGAIAGAKNGGLYGAIIGIGFMSVGLGPFYLWGCYVRAKISDRMTGRGAP